MQEPIVIAEGDKAPGFTVVTDQGRRISPSNFDGKLLVLNFWATWCDGCVREIRSLDAFQQEFSRQGVVVVGVSMDRNETRYTQFLQQFQIGFGTMRDPDCNLSNSFGTFQLPETYIIDPSGKVIKKIVAAYNFMDPHFVAEIRNLL
jgi:cytochrome c biogenesis protein CcmG/thiol:disulfide interchange protein DsbE